MKNRLACPRSSEDTRPVLDCERRHESGPLKQPIGRQHMLKGSDLFVAATRETKALIAILRHSRRGEISISSSRFANRRSKLMSDAA